MQIADINHNSVLSIVDRKLHLLRMHVFGKSADVIWTANDWARRFHGLHVSRFICHAINSEECRCILVRRLLVFESYQYFVVLDQHSLRHVQRMLGFNSGVDSNVSDEYRELFIFRVSESSRGELLL